MDRITLRLIQERFHSFAQSFRSDETVINDNILLKEDHTLRVCALSEKLAHSLVLSTEDTNLAMAIAILHDIGRFPQFARYRTFRDNQSVNHAELGLTVLDETSLLEGVSSPDQQIIREAVLNHNRMEIENGLDESTLLHARLIRDADKLDIIPLMVEYYDSRRHSPKPGLELSFPDTPGYSSVIIAHIERSEPVPNSVRRNYNDLKLTQLSWLYDLNYGWSRQYANEHRFTDKLKSHLPDDETINSIVTLINERLTLQVS
jgi:putative nucleotidyltransferase with HDIG domain